MDDLKGVKSCIRSLLTASASVSTIDSLEKDYRGLIGTNIPASKYGYRDTEQFLKSISDTCLVRGTGRFAAVTPVITEKVAHINEMVMRQRPAKSRKPSRPQRIQQRKYFSPGPSVRPPTYSFSRSSYSSCTASGSSSYFARDNFSKSTSIEPKTISQEPSVRLPIPEKPHVNSSSIPEKPRVNNSSAALEKPCVNNNHTDSFNNSINKNVDSNQSNIVQGVLTEQRLSQNTRQHSLEQEKLIRTQQYVAASSSAGDEKAEYCTADSITGFTRVRKIQDNTFRQKKKESVIEPEVLEPGCNVPGRVRDYLAKLISNHSNGIWCTDLLSEYKKEYNKDLRYNEYGYASLIHMCMALKDVFHCIRPDQGDFKLYDVKKPLPNSIRRPTSAYLNQNNSSFKDGDAISALPDLDWSDYEPHIPEDIVRKNEEVAREFLPGVKVGDVLDVTLVEKYDPSKFWFYLSDSSLDDLMDKMQEFYNNKENQTRYNMPKSLMKIGIFCVQIIFKEYHRAVIISDIRDDGETLKLYFIDYGSVAVHNIKGICFLKKEFAILPMQATRCRLANIVPVYEDSHWPLEARERFNSLVDNKDLKLKVTYVSYDEQYVSGFLADTTDLNIIYINEQLVKDGYARWFNEVNNGIVVGELKKEMQLFNFWKLTMYRKAAMIKKQLKQ